MLADVLTARDMRMREKLRHKGNPKNLLWITWEENLIILVIYVKYPVNPFIAFSGISQFREFRETARSFSIMHDYKIENG